MAEKLTQAELARALGVSRQAIHKLVAEGKLPMDEDKRIDLDVARAAISGLHPGSKTAQAVRDALAKSGDAPAEMGSAQVATMAATPPAAQDGDANGMTTSYHVARTLREVEEARMAKLKREEMEGQVIRVTAVEAVWAASLAQAREKFLQLSIRLSPLLAVETDPLKIDAMLQAELTEALQVIAGCDVRPKQDEGTV